MGLGTADIEAMLDDLAAAGGAVEIVLAAATVTGLFDHEARELFGEEMPAVVAADKTVHVKSSDVAGVGSGAAARVDGIDYAIMKVLPYGDGLMSVLLLRSA